MRRALVLGLALARCACQPPPPPPPDTPDGCVRRTCMEGDCGGMLDGCGGILQCPACSSGESCGGAGTPNRCGAGTCQPRSCFEQGKNCNFVSDGCSKVLDCGRCRRPSDCGMFGKPPNVCGGPSCDRFPCDGACDTFIDDGCGGQRDCFDAGCMGPFDSCGGGGTRNRCGCMPRTCLDLGKDCGESGDGCGGVLQCGSCAADAGTCGGSGFLHVCGSCPQAQDHVCTGSCWCWASPTPTGARIGAIAAADSTRVWLLTGGGAFARGDESGFGGVAVPMVTAPTNSWVKDEGEVYVVARSLLRFDGGEWSVENVPTTHTLMGVWGWGSELWVATLNGEVFHRAGTGAWSSELDAGQGLVDIWGSGPDDIWAGGEELRHFDGGSWGPPTAVTRVIDLHGSARDDVWAVDRSLAVFHFDGVDWARVPQVSAVQVAAIARDDVWAVSTSVAQHFDGTVWTRESLGAGDPITALWARAHDDVWVAAGSELFHRDVGGWHRASSAPRGRLNSVYVESASRAWAVGEQGRILRYDGAAWRPVFSGTSLALTAVHGAAVRVWAVGQSGVILTERNGVFMPESSGTTSSLNAVHAVSASELYAAGNGVWLRSDGSGTWLAEGATAAISALWGSSDHDLWLGDIGGRLHHLDDAGWHDLNTNLLEPVTALWGGGGSLFVTLGGVSGAFGSLLRYEPFDGGFAEVATPSEALTSIWGTSSSDLWFAGTHGALRHWDGGTLATLASPTTDTLLGIGGASGGPMFAVGELGTALRIENGSARNAWVEQEHVDGALLALWGFGANELWVADNGRVHHFDGRHWLTQALAGGPVLFALWGPAPDDLWAAGNGLFHYDGRSWSSVSSPLSSVLMDLWGSGPADVWTVSGDEVAHGDGASWRKSAFGGAGFGTVFGSGASDVWATGIQLWHFDGAAWTQLSSPSPGQQFASGWCASTDDCWAVGRGGGAPSVIRWNGSRWRIVNLDAPTAARVWGRSRDDVFVFCSDGTLQHWDGVRFALQRTGAGEPLAVWGGDAGIWISGNRSLVFHP